MATICKYCNIAEDKQEKPGLICENCIGFVHLTCLKQEGTPGDFSGDVFFDFTCEDCSVENKEVFVRNRFPWVNALLLTLHHLSQHSYGISNHGFFHYKTHICSFIDRNWILLFGLHFKQKKNWVGTIAGVLSVYNQLFFRSGSVALGESGWWKLLHSFSPAVAAHIIQEMARDKPKGRPRNQIALDKTLFRAKVTEMGYQDLINDAADLPIPGVVPAAKKRRLDSDEMSAISTNSYYNEHTLDPDRSEVIEESIFEEATTLVTNEELYDSEQLFRGFEFVPNASFAPPPVSQSDSSSINSLQQTPLFYDSDAHSGSPTHDQEDPKPDKIKKPPPPEEKPIVKRESLFSAELNSVDLPWIEKPKPPDQIIVEMTEYEEIQLLKQVESLISKVKDPNKKAYLHRLRAKLSLRRLKRHKHLPLFDLDKVVKLLGGYVQEDPKITMNVERILDRFQRSYLLDNLTGTIASTTYGTMVLSRIEPAPFRSAYSGATLKPYIRRDAHTQPLWLLLMDQLLRRTNRHIKDYSPPPRATLDYSYVRPQHIAAVNSLCAQFFWPGIDLTEALESPELSCVVSYRRLVVGCAFLVADARAPDAYISFILTRPEWRRAGIATFMLYHLLQTCTGKDVTLHVSPTNPAIFLYQKFGFKVEELIQDFYEKYYDIDYKGCRHALFLRLVR